MDFFEDLKGKAQTLTQVGVSKSKHLMEVAKLKMASASESESIRKAYQEMGKIYYAERGMAPEPAFVALCDQVSASRAIIRHNNEALAALKNNGVVSEEDLGDMDEYEDFADFEDMEATPEVVAEVEPESDVVPEVVPEVEIKPMVEVEPQIIPEVNPETEIYL